MAATTVNKVVYGGKTLIDLTSDTVTADKLLKGVKAHDQSGASIVGTCEFDANTQDATAQVAEILSGKTAYVRGSKLTGTMPNIGSSGGGTISTKDGSVSIKQGFHDGTAKVVISESEKTKLVGNNIKQGVTILGVLGTLEPSSEIQVQDKTFTPTPEGTTIVPDENYDYLAQVVINPIPYSETENSAGGLTVQIASTGDA